MLNDDYYSTNTKDPGQGQMSRAYSISLKKVCLLIKYVGLMLSEKQIDDSGLYSRQRSWHIQQI